MRRKAVLVSWKLFGQWWCLPVDQTPEEKATFLTGLQHNLGDDFAQCPLAFIEDRLYGGFKCEDANRRHVYFAVAEYSFLAAGRGEFWANHGDRRFETRTTLFDKNAATWVGDGPFTEVVTA